MELISENYKTLNRKLHADDATYGASGGTWVDDVARLMAEQKFVSALDYGAGKGELAKGLAEREIAIYQYDPAVPGIDDALALVPHELVICTDVLEHIEPDRIQEVINHIHFLTTRALFFSISCQPARKLLEDGRNAHLIVNSPDLWIERLETRFELVNVDIAETRVTGIARPLALIGEINVKAAVTDEVRGLQSLENIAFFPGRLTPKITKANKDLKTLEAHDRTALLVCFGPSLQSTFGDAVLRSAQPDHDLFSVSAAYRFLTERGVSPKAHMDCDPRPHKVTQVGDVDPNTETEFWLASCVHPSWQQKVPRDKVRLWHAYCGEAATKMIEKADPGRGQICGGGSIGLRAIALLYFLGYRRIVVYGLDSSFSDEGEQWAGEHHGKRKLEMVVVSKGKKYRTAPALIAYARYFGKMLELMPDCEVELTGDGLLQSMYG